MSKKLTLRPATNEELANVIQDLAKNTDAGTALVTVAAIDEWLQKLLLTAMRPLSKNEANRIFDSYGSLYELAPKADMAYAFDLITAETLAALRALVKIRNTFAHTRDPLHFDSKEIVHECHALPGWKKGVQPRMLFDEAAKKCVQAIDAKTQEIVFKKSIQADASPSK